MAQENVGININVQGNAVESIGNVKKALKEANAELINAQSNFGDYSQEAIAAAKRVAELKDRISEARETADLFDPGKKFQVFAGAVNAVAGGFTAVQGALGLVGAESEELQKSLLKVQSALALSQGLSAVTDSAKDFQRLATIVKTNVVSAFSTLRGALIATGIGALAIGIGLVAANFDKVKKAVLNLVPGLAQVGTFFSSIITKVTDFVGVTSQAERALSSLEQTTKRGNEGIEARIKVLTAQGGKEKEIYALSKQQGENELTFLRAKLKSKEGLNEEELKKFRALKTEQAVLDIQEQKRINAAAEENAKKSKDASKEASARNKADADLRKKDTEDRLQAEKEALQKLSDLRNQLFLSTFKDENEKKKAELNLAFIQEKDEILANTKITEDTRNQLIVAARLKLNADLDAIAATEKEKKDAADAKLLEDSAARMQKEDEDEFNALKSKNKKLFEENLEFKEADNKIDKLSAEQKIALAQQTADALVAVSSILGKETAAGKALAISAALINTYQGISAGVKLGFPAAIPAVALAAATGFSAVKNIIATKVPGAASSGGAGNMTAPNVSASAPITPPQPQAATTNLSNQTINAIGNQAIRSYVVESDVTSNQQRIAAIQQRARFG
jgi:hypothetical protein